MNQQFVIFAKHVFVGCYDKKRFCRKIQYFYTFPNENKHRFFWYSYLKIL